MLQIEIKTNHILTRSGTSRKTGQPYLLREQEAWIHLQGTDGALHPYPTRMVISLADDQPPYAPGTYTLSPSSLFVGAFSRLTLGRLALVPAPAPAIKAA